LGRMNVHVLASPRPNLMGGAEMQHLNWRKVAWIVALVALGVLIGVYAFS
jgi:hypothetical protein